MFLDPKFWLAISFLLFLCLVIKYVMPKILALLDDKSKQVADEIAQAKQLKEEAEKLFSDAKKHREESLEYSKKLIEDAKNEASRLLADSQRALEEEIAKRTSLAKEKIKTEEEKAIREIKSEIINSAIKIVEEKAANISSNQAAQLSAKSIENISRIIN
ncbi:MAG: hypothetical protein K0R25_617 [Rickettsiaceae bacterium]|jgi:F-type H+-transporting ATPase subunit b|nr:hypothetical protein [Rickettsiaceae bacterium]